MKLIKKPQLKVKRDNLNNNNNTFYKQYKLQLGCTGKSPWNLLIGYNFKRTKLENIFIRREKKKGEWGGGNVKEERGRKSR